MESVTDNIMVSTMLMAFMAVFMVNLPVNFDFNVKANVMVKFIDHINCFSSFFEFPSLAPVLCQHSLSST